jgi:hypothetical protein
MHHPIFSIQFIFFDSPSKSFTLLILLSSLSFYLSV